MIDEATISQIVALIVAVIMAIYGIWQNRKKNAIVAFYDPNTVDSVIAAAVPPEVKADTWKMSDETKRWITYNESPADQALILTAISQAEAERRPVYTITYSKGWYNIEYGLMKASGRGD